MWASMTVSPNMVGQCSFLWRWPFGGSEYSSCWDAVIPAPTTSPPEQTDTNGSGNGSGNASGGTTILGINTGSSVGTAAVVGVPILVVAAAGALFYFKKRKVATTGAYTSARNPRNAIQI